MTFQKCRNYYFAITITRKRNSKKFNEHENMFNEYTRNIQFIFDQLQRNFIERKFFYCKTDIAHAKRKRHDKQF